MWIPENMFVALVVLLIILLLIYYKGTSTYNYWKKKGIPYIKPKYPFFGTQFETAFSLQTVKDQQQIYYKYFKGERFGGTFFFTEPTLFIRDPELIETTLIKEFTSFYNRGNGVDIKLDPLSAHLVNLDDQQWKSLRQKLTPTFSSGKIKGMHQQLIECADILVNYIGNHVERSEPLEIKEVTAKFTTDVIGSCVFGLNTNTLGDEESEFRKFGRKIFAPSFGSRLRLSLRRYFPEFLKLLRWKGRSKEIEIFFNTMLKSTMAYREKNKIERNDFVQLLMELKKQDEEKLQNGNTENDENLIIDDKIITANAFVFFVAGFETTALTISYCLYEISRHPDIQEQAYQHIVTVLKKHGGEVTYDAVKDMTFINEIFAETLRLHPPIPDLRRVVTKPFTIPESSLTLPKGLWITFPVYSLHHDPEHFPEPEKFIPERFNKELNIIKKGTYLPFGDGPRSCIGKLFAKMEMQVAFVKLLLKYKFSLNPKTISPLMYNPASYFMAPIGGIWLDLHKRN